MSSPSSASPAVSRRRCVPRRYGAAKKCSRSVTEPGLMYTSKTCSTVADRVAGLLLGLAADGGLGVVLVEQAGRGLDEHAVGVLVHVRREAELPGEQHGALLPVVEQDGRAVAAVVGLALLGAPLAVGVLEVERRRTGHVPVRREHAHVAHPHARVAVEAAPHEVEARAATAVGHVDAGLRHPLVIGAGRGVSRRHPLAHAVGAGQRKLMNCRSTSRSSPLSSAMVACRSSRLFDGTRSSSPWIWLFTLLGASSRMIFEIFLAFSLTMPFLSADLDAELLAGRRTAHPSRATRSVMPRLMSFDSKTSSTALTRSSVLALSSTFSPLHSTDAPTPLKS